MNLANSLPEDIENIIREGQEVPLGPNDAHDLRELMVSQARRIAELEADAEVWSASVSDLARKVVAAKARAEAAEAQLALANQEIEQHAERILNLLLDERKVREWARGRCETCGYMLMDLPDRYGAACGECENGTNWTPAWEVK